jgi:AbiTii
MDLISKLQSDALKPDVPVAHLLRTAKIVATRLDLKDALVWIDRELTGYMDLKPEDLSPYRRLEGEPKAWNPYRGWQPIYFPEAEQARFFSQAPIGQAVGAMEKSLGEKREGRYIFTYPPEIKTHLMAGIDFPTEICIHITYGALWNIVDQVRNLILDWSLELEKAGIVGEDMTFTAEEKREAGPVTQQFFIQNVGVLGQVNDRARVTNQQTALATLDLGQVQDFVTQARGALDGLPTATRREMQPVLDDLERKLNSPTPDRSKLSTLLGSVRAICEGAAGNLTAEGMVQLLGRLLAG